MLSFSQQIVAWLVVVLQLALCYLVGVFRVLVKLLVELCKLRSKLLNKLGFFSARILVRVNFNAKLLVEPGVVFIRQVVFYSEKWDH